MSTLITGADGFVGRALRGYWRGRGVAFVGMVRAIGADAAHPEELVAVGDYATAPWSTLLRDVETIVHLAGRAHVLHDEPDAEGAYGQANAEVTRLLARAAFAAKVRRVVFASSVKVNGEGRDNRSYDEDDVPAPEGAYGRSKWEAEQALREAAGEARREATILRLPLVYGPGVKGNFLSLMRRIDRGHPLPVGAIDNRRSFLFVGNLSSAIELAATHAAAANRTYFVTDGEPVATPELCRRLAAALGVRARLVSVPGALLRGLGVLAGQQRTVERVTGSLMVVDDRIRRELGWTPPYDMDAGLRQTALWWRTIDRHTRDRA